MIGRELVVVSIDFDKAFDRVGRMALVRALHFYKCDPKPIDVIAILCMEEGLLLLLYSGLKAIFIEYKVVPKDRNTRAFSMDSREPRSHARGVYPTQYTSHMGTGPEQKWRSKRKKYLLIHI